MEPDIQEACHTLPTSKAVWRFLLAQYMTTETRVFDIMTRFFSVAQGGQSVASYITKLSSAYRCFKELFYVICPESPSAPVSDLPIALRKGTRQCTTRHPISHVLNYTALSVSDRSFLARLDAITVPRTLSEALSHPGWRQAMQEELAALKSDLGAVPDPRWLPVGLHS